MKAHLLVLLAASAIRVEHAGRVLRAAGFGLHGDNRGHEEGEGGAVARTKAAGETKSGGTSTPRSSTRSSSGLISSYGRVIAFFLSSGWPGGLASRRRGGRGALPRNGDNRRASGRPSSAGRRAACRGATGRRG